jgi:hypothetical protein
LGYRIGGKKYICGQGGWDFRSSGKRPQRAHPQLVHWWLLVHSSRQYVICTVKLDEENGKYASLDEENGFSSPKLYSLRRLVKGASTLCTPQKQPINVI